MSFEAARKELANRLSQLKVAQTRSSAEISAAKQLVIERQDQHRRIEDEIAEIAGALQQLGGPVPDWTDDPDLVKFWDEVKK